MSLIRPTLVVVLWFLSIAPAFAQASAPACEFGQMEQDPHSVIEPCSKLLDDPSLTSDARAQAFFVRGRAYTRTGQVKAAAQDFDVAAKLSPKRSDIYVSRSSAEYKLGRWQDGWADLNLALTLDPKNAQAFRAMGMAYQNGGDFAEAIRLYSKALDIDPNEPYALLLRSQRYAAKHDFKAALLDATALVAMAPGVINRLGYVDARGMLSDFHAVAFDNRAQIYAQIGDDVAAEKDFDAAIVEKRSSYALTTRAEFLFRHDKQEAALKDFQEAAQLDPTDGDIQFDVGLSELEAHRFPDALAAFDKASDLHVHLAGEGNQLGYDLLMKARSLRGLDRTDEAADTIEKALCVSPDVRASTMVALTRGGYWTGLVAPIPATPAFKAALRACMIDKDCN